MRITFSVLLLLLAAPAAFAQAPAVEAAPLVPMEAEPVPSVVSGSSAVLEPTRAEVRVNADATPVRAHVVEETTSLEAAQRQNRSYYFVLGALIALVAVLVFAL